MANKVLGMHRLKNKVNRNAFDLSHRHMFTAQVGELSDAHMLCLVISELMEAVEADRKGKRANVDRYNKKIANSRICQWLDPDIPKERGYEVAYNETIKGSIEEELADAVIRLLDLAGLRSIDLNLAMKDLNNNIDDMSEACKDETFTESIYAISTLPVRYDGLYDFPSIS